ncbi:unnamed protein product [Symbiodinium natans]|uniref:Uncharacterized protein n=1 Tax=Symbiodinium natans TaxID=878477 RepID=A0A812JMI4_9DINO|nr:unnamed protein product [Symbiodinium natans]
MEQTFQTLLKAGRSHAETEEDMRRIFRHFGHQEDRGWRLSPLELEQLLQAAEERLLPEGFASRLFQAWAPGLDSLTEGRFMTGFRVYLEQREQWFEQWWLAKSGGTSAKPPSHRLVSELRKDAAEVGFEQFREFCSNFAEDSGYVPPPASFLRAVWQACVDNVRKDSGRRGAETLPDSAYDALLDSYAGHWRLWLEDWIAEREVTSVPAKKEESEEVKAAITVQRHFRAYQARKRVDTKKSEVLLSDLIQNMSNKATAAKLFERFDSGKKDYWTAEDMARFCDELWPKQDGMPPPPAAFGADAVKKVRSLAGARPRKVLAKMAEEEEVVLTREEFRRGLLAWNDKRHRQLKKWERARYCEVYACPCCRGRFRVVAVPVASESRSLEIAKVIDEGIAHGVTALTGVRDPPRFPLPGRFTAAPGSAARKLPHPSEVAHLHSEVANAVAAGAALCVLPPGCARPALAGRLLLQAAVTGAGRGAPVLLLAQDGEMDAVQLWIQSASPGYPMTRFSPQEPSRWQESIGKVCGNELPRLLMATPKVFQGLVLDNKASAKNVDFVLMSCSQSEVPLLKECDEQAPFTISASRPRVVCLLDSTSQAHEALLEHLEALQEAKGHMSAALEHLEAAQSLHGQPGGFAQANLEDFSRRVARFPAAARPTEMDLEDVPEALPLGFTGPLQALKRRAVIPAFQKDDLSSESDETPSSSPSPTKAADILPKPGPSAQRAPAPAASAVPTAKPSPQSFF